MSGSRMTFGPVFYVSYVVCHEKRMGAATFVRWIHLEQVAPVASGSISKMVDNAFLEVGSPQNRLEMCLGVGLCPGELLEIDSESHSTLNSRKSKFRGMQVETRTLPMKKPDFPRPKIPKAGRSPRVNLVGEEP